MTGAQLYEIQKDANMNPHKMKHLSALPNEHDDFLALVGSGFNWSPDKNGFRFWQYQQLLCQLMVIPFA